MLNTLLKESFRATGQQRIITPAWHLILPVIFRVPCLLFSRLYYSFGLSIMSTVRYHHMSKTLQYVKDDNNGKFSSYSEIMNKMYIFWQIFMKVNQSRGVQWLWMEFVSKGQGHIGSSKNSFFRAYILSSKPILAHTSHERSLRITGV